MRISWFVHRLDRVCLSCSSPEVLNSIYLLRDTLLETKLFHDLTLSRKLEFLLRLRHFLKCCTAADANNLILSALRELLFSLCRPVWSSKSKKVEAFCYRQSTALRVFKKYCALFERTMKNSSNKYYAEERLIAEEEFLLLEDSCNFMFAYQRAYRIDEISAECLRKLKKNMRYAHHAMALPDLTANIAATRSVLHDEICRMSEMSQNQHGNTAEKLPYTDFEEN